MWTSPKQIVLRERYIYWSFRALLPNSHASSQVDEYRKRIRKTGETAYLHSELSVHLRVRITLELRKIYPERIECFNSIMLSGIRLCFSLWVAQMSLSSIFSWNNVSAYCLWHIPGSVLAFTITSLNMPASVSGICDHSMWHVFPH